MVAHEVALSIRIQVGEIDGTSYMKAKSMNFFEKKILCAFQSVFGVSPDKVVKIFKTQFRKFEKSIYQDPNSCASA